MPTLAGLPASTGSMKKLRPSSSILRLLVLFFVWNIGKRRNVDNGIVENEQMAMWQRVFGRGREDVKQLEAGMLRVEEQLRRDNEKLNAEIQQVRVEIESHTDVRGMLVRDVLQAAKILEETREEDASRQANATEGEALKKRFAVFQDVVALCVHGCLEGFSRRIVRMLGDTAVEILQSWDRSSLGVRIVLPYLSLHDTWTLWKTLKNSRRLMSL